MYAVGQQVIVNNEKLKTHGCTGTILGEHEHDYSCGSFWYGSYDVEVDYKGSKITTFIHQNNLKPVKQKI